MTARIIYNLLSGTAKLNKGSQRKVAAALGLSESCVSQKLRGIRPMNVLEFVAVCDALGLEIEIKEKPKEKNSDDDEQEDLLQYD